MPAPPPDPVSTTVDASPPTALSGDLAPTAQNTSEPGPHCATAPAETIAGIPPSDQSSKDTLPGNTASLQVASLTPDVNANHCPPNDNGPPPSSGIEGDTASQEVDGAARVEGNGTVSAGDVSPEKDITQPGDEGGDEGTASSAQQATPKNVKEKSVRGSKEKARTWSQREPKETRASRKKASEEEQDSAGPAKRLRGRTGR